MLGIKAIFAAMQRLATAVNRSAELFELANGQLAERLGFEESTPALEHSPEPEPLPATRNGRKAKA